MGILAILPSGTVGRSRRKGTLKIFDLFIFQPRRRGNCKKKKKGEALLAHCCSMISEGRREENEIGAWQVELIE